MNTRSNTASPLVWIVAITAASSLATQIEDRLPVATSARFLGALGPLEVTILVNLAVTILVVLAVPFFEVVTPRHRLVAVVTALVGVSAVAAATLGDGAQPGPLSMVVLATAAAFAQFLSVAGDVTYIGLLSHSERVGWYLLKRFGAALPGILLLSMVPLMHGVPGSQQTASRDLAIGGTVLIVLAGLLWRLLPEFGERDAPAPRTSWRKVIADATDDLRKLDSLWPTVAVFVVLPLPAHSMHQIELLMLLQPGSDGGFGLSNTDAGMILGVFASVGSLAGLLGAWFTLRRVPPERLVLFAIALSTVGALGWWLLAASRQTSLVWISVTACLEGLSSSFAGVVAMILAMQNLGVLRHYATAFVWLATAAALSSAIARSIGGWVMNHANGAAALRVIGIASLVLAAGCAALWSKHTARATG